MLKNIWSTNITYLYIQITSSLKIAWSHKRSFQSLMKNILEPRNLATIRRILSVSLSSVSPDWKRRWSTFVGWPQFDCGILLQLASVAIMWRSKKRVVFIQNGLIYKGRRHHYFEWRWVDEGEMIDYDRMRERFITVNNTIIWVATIFFLNSWAIYMIHDAFKYWPNFTWALFDLTNHPSGQVDMLLTMIYLVLDQCFPMRQIQTLMMTWSCPMLQPTMNQAVLASGEINFENFES